MVENTVAAWHQESRDVCLMMARKLYRHVRLKLPRAHVSDPLLRMKVDCERLVTDHKLECALEIPDAAAPLVITADLLRRSLCISMTLQAPADKQRASSRINWVLRQLAKSDPTNLYVRAVWPGRTQATQASLSTLREDPSRLEIENKSTAPSSFDVMLIHDIAGKFGGAKTFLEQLESAVPMFYERVGQYIRAYVAPPPRIAHQRDQAIGELTAEQVISQPVVPNVEELSIIEQALTAEEAGSSEQSVEPGLPENATSPRTLQPE